MGASRPAHGRSVSVAQARNAVGRQRDLVRASSGDCIYTDGGRRWLQMAAQSVQHTVSRCRLCQHGHRLSIGDSRRALCNVVAACGDGKGSRDPGRATMRRARPASVTRAPDAGEGGRPRRLWMLDGVLVPVPLPPQRQKYGYFVHLYKVTRER